MKTHYSNISTNVLVMVLLWTIPSSMGQYHHVMKRALLFPRYSIMQLSIGVSAPVILPNRTINLSLAAQANYDWPWNLTQLQPYVISARETASSFFDVDRPTLYKYVIDYLDGNGISGQDCLLRSICEISEHPVYRQGPNTVLEKIIHYLFTPSEDSIYNSFYKGFIEAERIGRAYGDCHQAFSGCPFSFISYLTTKEYHS